MNNNDEITLRMNEDGVFEKYEEPFAVIECQTEEDFKQIKTALERQMPKKVTHEASLIKCCTCPNCKNVVDKFEQWGETKVRITEQFCHFCGQALDWEKEKI